MSTDSQELRINGIYRQRDGRYMQRIKLAAGSITAPQALAVADIADAFAGNRVHLTTRGSIELHDLAGDVLEDVGTRLAVVGLAGRGACGGAVRGVSSSSSTSPDFPHVQAFGRRLHDHFTGKPHFEGLPKKFKISVDAGYFGARHLIQDAGLVMTGLAGETSIYDIWTGGGLGREPRPAFLLCSGLAESRIIPLLEKIIAIYRERTAPGRRLKHLIAEIGEEGFRALITEACATPDQDSPGTADPIGPSSCPAGSSPIRIEVGIFAGELSTSSLRGLAGIAEEHANGTLTVTADQNVTIQATTIVDATAACQRLTELGHGGTTPEETVVFRVCPGSHDCRMGLAPTRTIAGELIALMNSSSRHRSWAISGCQNSCSQPQLAEMGIVASRLVKEPDGSQTPRFTLLARRDNASFAVPLRQDITLDDLLDSVNSIA